MQRNTTFTYKGWFGPTDDLLNPIWNLRLCPLVALLGVFLAETVFRTGFAHGLCLGLSAAMLTTAVALSFQITGVTLRRPPERSDVDELSVTR